MKIAQLAPNIYPIPPAGYGGTELVVGNITEGLVAGGNDVTLFASGDSKTKAKLYKTAPKSLANTPGFKMRDFKKYLAEVAQQFIKVQNQFEIVHIHIEDSAARFADEIKIPSIYTHHGIFSPEVKEVYNRNINLLRFTALSKSQMRLMPNLNYFGVVYHGLEISKYRFSPKGDEPLYFIGKIDPVKGTDVAVKVAQKLKKNLNITGNISSSHTSYFTEKIEPYLTPKIRYHGVVDFGTKIDFFDNSKVTLFPIDWEEAFGLVMIESMACGTPVVAFRRGSVPEVIVDGETGFIVEPGNVGAMVEAVKRIYDMPEGEYKEMRKRCREHVEKNFIVERMVEGYEKVYQNVIKDWTNRRKSS